MSSCEKCWADAYRMVMGGNADSQTEAYMQLIEERKDNPCSPKDQAGQWWDDEKQCDSRRDDD